MKSPLLVLLEWLGAQPGEVRWWLASQSLVYLGNANRVDYSHLERDESCEAYLAWLKEPLFACVHVGRCLQACALIEFFIETRGVFAAEWERDELEARLALGDCAAAEAEAMQARADAIKAGTAMWRDAATSWRQLRQSMLSADVMQAWEEAAPITHPLSLYAQQ